MATRQKRVSQRDIKRETEATDGAQFVNDQASDDLDKAEALLEEKKRLKKESPSKVSFNKFNQAKG